MKNHGPQTVFMSTLSQIQDVTDYFYVKCECIISSELLTMGVRSRSGSFTVGDTEEGRPELGPGADCSELRGGVSDVDNVLKVEPS